MDDLSVKKILGTCKDLEHLDLTGCLEVSGDAFIENHCRLKWLSVAACCRIEQSTLVEIRNYCPNLIELKWGKIRENKMLL